MLYLLDANVLISANATYYPIRRIPIFWEWLVDQAKQGLVKIPPQIYDEITPSEVLFRDWLKEHKGVMVLEEPLDKKVHLEVLEKGYGLKEFDESELNKKRDPILIAYAAKVKKARTVVTLEVRKPNRIDINRKIPDVCENIGVVCILDWELYEKLDFKIS